MAYFEDNAPSIPPVMPPQFGKAEDMMKMLRSMVLLVSTLFHTEVGEGTSNILSLCLRIFLAELEIFEKPMRSPTDDPMWLSSFNYLCIKNLPRAVQMFGPMHQWFEAKWLGEKFVSKVKT